MTEPALAPQTPTDQTPVPSLADRLAAVVAGTAHRAVCFRDLSEVPIGSLGYFSPSGTDAVRSANGWVGRDGHPVSPGKQIFTAQSGPKNDEILVDALLAALTPAHRVLIEFEVVTEYESGDWELSQPGYHYSDLANPQLLGHGLSESELARLVFQIEAVGTLGEADAYDDVDKLIDTAGASAAEKVREQARANPLGLGDLFFNPQS